VAASSRFERLIRAILDGDLVAVRRLLDYLWRRNDPRRVRIMVATNQLLRSHQTIRTWYGHEIDSNSRLSHEELARRRREALREAWDRFERAIIDCVSIPADERELQRAARDFKAARKQVEE
jgi:type II secretory pathway predicted ATPase ExeA